ncbi:hypothetical protein [Geodermatophilus sp. SYSU D01119]
MTASTPPAGPRTQEIAVPTEADAPHGATAAGAPDAAPAPAHAPAHAAPPVPSSVPLPPPAYPTTAPQPVAHVLPGDAPTAVVPPVAADGPQPTGPLDSFFGTPPPPPPAAAPAPVQETLAAPEAPKAPKAPKAPRTPRDRAVLVTAGLGLLGLVLLELGLALRLGGQVLWADLPLWSGFATLAALAGVVGLAASLLPGGRLSPAVADRVALGGLAGLAVFWVLIALPRVDSDRGFLLTAALGALAVGVWLAPHRRAR